MGRLLDMEEIIKFAKTTYPTEDVKKITWLLCHTPTAYNVEKVVEELEEKTKSSNYEIEGTITRKGYIKGIKDAIEIVRKGGVE